MRQTETISTFRRMVFDLNMNFFPNSVAPANLLVYKCDCSANPDSYCDYLVNPISHKKKMVDLGIDDNSLFLVTVWQGEGTSLADLLQDLGIESSKYSIRDLNYIMDKDRDAHTLLRSQNISKTEVERILASVRSKVKSETQRKIAEKEGLLLDNSLNITHGQSKSSLYYAFSESAGVLVAKVYANCKDDFQREVEMSAKFNHPSIVKFIKSFEIPGDRYGIIMPFYPRSAYDLCNQYSKVPLKSIATIAHDCFYALEHIHSVGYCFGDLKPSNIMLEGGEKGHAVLVDFGATVKLRSPIIESTERYCLDTPKSIGSKKLDWTCYASTIAELAGVDLDNYNSSNTLIDDISLCSLDPLLNCLIISALKGDTDSILAELTEFTASMV